MFDRRSGSCLKNSAFTNSQKSHNVKPSSNLLQPGPKTVRVITGQKSIDAQPESVGESSVGQYSNGMLKFPLLEQFSQNYVPETLHNPYTGREDQSDEISNRIYKWQNPYEKSSNEPDNQNSNTLNVKPNPSVPFLQYSGYSTPSETEQDQAKTSSERASVIYGVKPAKILPPAHTANILDSRSSKIREDTDKNGYNAWTQDLLSQLSKLLAYYNNLASKNSWLTPTDPVAQNQPSLTKIPYQPNTPGNLENEYPYAAQMTLNYQQPYQPMVNGRDYGSNSYSNQANRYPATLNQRQIYAGAGEAAPVRYPSPIQYGGQQANPWLNGDGGYENQYPAANYGPIGYTRYSAVKDEDDEEFDVKKKS